TDLRDDQFELLGDPPRAVRAVRELPPVAVAEMLRAPSAPALLELLGITGKDLAELSALIGPAVEDPEILGEITRTANLLRAGAGLEVPAADLAALGREHGARSEEHTSELQSRFDLVCRLLLEKKNEAQQLTI